MRPRRLALALCLALAPALLLALAARAAPLVGSDVDSRFAPAFTTLLESSRLSAMLVQPDGRILVGGPFRRVAGLDRRDMARLNPDGSLDPSFAHGVSGTFRPRALALQPDGKIVVATLSATSPLRLNSDGSLDPSFSAALGLNARPQALAVQPDGKIIVAGRHYVDTVTSYGFVLRLTAEGQLDPAFTAHTTLSGPVDALALLPDGKLLIGGGFALSGEGGATGLARLLPDGAVDPAFAPVVAGAVSTLALAPDGSILAGGAFAQVNDVAQANLARLLADGSLDAAYRPRLDGAVKQVALEPGGAALLAGQFVVVNGLSRPGLARLMPDGRLDETLNDAADWTGPVDMVAPLAGGAVLAGGSFGYDHLADIWRPLVRLYGPAAPGALGLAAPVAALDEGAGALTLTLSRGQGADRYVAAALRVVGGSAAAGGDYHLPALAEDEGDGPPVGRQVVAQPDGRLIVAGNFTLAGGRYAGRIARLYPDGSLDPSFDAGAGADRLIEALALQPDGKILVGGSFLHFDGRPRPYMARLHPDGSLDPGFAPVLNDRVWEIVPGPEGQIYIGGIFGGGDVPPALARLNPDGSFDRSFDARMEPSGYVMGLAIQPDGKIVAGGSFSHPQSSGRMVRLNPDGSTDIQFSYQTQAIDGPVRELALLPDGKILIVGDFRKVGGAGRDGVARLNPAGSLDQSFVPATGASAVGLDVLPLADGGALVAGQLRATRGAGYLARFGPAGALDIAPMTADGIVWDLARGPGGTALVAGEFVTIGGVARAGLARLGADGAVDDAFDARAGDVPVVVWADGDTADKALTLTIVDDALAEGDETVELELLPLGGAAAGQVALTLTIVDDDAAAATPVPTASAGPLPEPTPEPSATPGPVEARPHRVFLPATDR